MTDKDTVITSQGYAGGVEKTILYQNNMQLADVMVEAYGIITHVPSLYAKEEMQKEKRYMDSCNNLPK